jgi:cytochrome bd-I ubiquinol oxidase subunit X
MIASMIAPMIASMKGIIMWYFAWLLGLPLAAAFAVLNAMWFELVDDAKRRPVAPLPVEDESPRRLRA